MTQVLTFTCDRTDGEAAALMPCIDGVPLAELVTHFERQKGYIDPAGGYGGIVPCYFDLGPLPAYFLGLREPIQGGNAGQIYVLFC